jgi:hypothetical protein
VRRMVERAAKPSATPTGHSTTPHTTIPTRDAISPPIAAPGVLVGAGGAATPHGSVAAGAASVPSPHHDPLAVGRTPGGAGGSGGAGGAGGSGFPHGSVGGCSTSASVPPRRVGLRLRWRHCGVLGPRTAEVVGHDRLKARVKVPRREVVTWVRGDERV